MGLTKEEREYKKQQAKERREKRNERKAQKQAEEAKLGGNASFSNNQAFNQNEKGGVDTEEILKLKAMGYLTLDTIPEDDLVSILCFLPARDLGAVIMTCRYINQVLKYGCEQHLLTRLQPRYGMNEAEIRELIHCGAVENSSSNRLMSKKVKKGIGADDYPGFVRFIEETVCDFAYQNYGNGNSKQRMPAYAEGRIVSASPEHSLCRMGGDKSAGPGGSGCAAWGIGKRGQLGNGNREVSS